MKKHQSIERRPDWRTKLTEHLGLLPKTALVAGQNDCALTWAGAIEAMTGTDPAAPYRGRYSSFKGGLRVVAKAGFADLPTMLSSLFPEVLPVFAHEGDIAMIDDADSLALGLIQGEAIYVLYEGGGLGLVPRARATRCWHVPFAGEGS